ncbi:MAG: FKBP-type peptidyl-prolyl cis-trans isomerase FkpA, partial [Psychromonas sp.]
SLLDGTDCYKTEENEIDEFKIDRSEVESGVQEAIKLMRIGDKMKLIIPSHLAHGLTGDMNKVPPLSPIVVDLHLVHLKP